MFSKRKCAEVLSLYQQRSQDPSQLMLNMTISDNEDPEDESQGTPQRIVTSGFDDLRTRVSALQRIVTSGFDDLRTRVSALEQRVPEYTRPPSLSASFASDFFGWAV